MVSSLAMHNIADATDQGQAVSEAVRVLRPGGQIAIAGIRATRNYTATLIAAGMTNVSHRRLGWRFWFGGPQMATRLVTATKPANPGNR